MLVIIDAAGAGSTKVMNNSLSAQDIILS